MRVPRLPDSLIAAATRPLLPLILCGVALATGLYAQPHADVLPDLRGAALLRALQRDYTPAGPLDYGVARDTMFLRVWRTPGGQLVGQYTGYAIDLPARGVDPTEYAFDRGINTEHVYPRSRGTRTGDAEADMHHLFPTRIGVNADRASLPFAEIPDARTDRWYYLDQQRTSPPAASVRDRYSEGTGEAFEPREEVKGDVARAVFYVYTVYRDQVRAADPDFFADQLADLCAWHDADPVGDAEYARTLAVERTYQGNANPFVLDCSLAERLGYCPTVSQACRTVGTSRPSAAAAVRLAPNPARSAVRVEAAAPFARLRLVDALGRVVADEGLAAAAPIYELALAPDLAHGLYQVVLDEGRRGARLLVR